MEVRAILQNTGVYYSVNNNTRTYNQTNHEEWKTVCSQGRINSGAYLATQESQNVGGDTSKT